MKSSTKLKIRIKVLLKIQWIFVILLSLFVIRNFRGSRSSVEILKGYTVKERFGTPVLEAVSWHPPTSFVYICK